MKLFRQDMNTLITEDSFKLHKTYIYVTSNIIKICLNKDEYISQIDNFFI